MTVDDDGVLHTRDHSRVADTHIFYMAARLSLWDWVAEAATTTHIKRRAELRALVHKFRAACGNTSRELYATYTYDAKAYMASMCAWRRGLFVMCDARRQWAKCEPARRVCGIYPAKAGHATRRAHTACIPPPGEKKTTTHCATH